MRTIDEKKFARLRRYLRHWRTVPAIARHVGLSQRTIYRWLDGLWHELVKSGSRGRTKYRITD